MNTIKYNNKHNNNCLEPAEEKEYYPQTPAQKRLYMLHRLDENGTLYNLTREMPLANRVEYEHLKRTFDALIRRHEILRTSFCIIDDHPVQRVHPSETMKFHLEKTMESEREADGNRLESFIRSFDLAKAPLIRAQLTESGPPHYRQTLSIDMHHIITDAASQQLLVDEFVMLYNGGHQPPLKYQYKDYAQWLTTPERQAEIQRQEAFWIEVYETPPPSLELPYDYPRPRLQSFKGRAEVFVLDMETTAQMKQFIVEENVTGFMVLQAMWAVLMSKLSGQEDIAIGIPVAGRQHEELQRISGLFVNTIPLRTEPRGEMTVIDYLNSVKKNALQAFENQEFPFEEMVEKINLQRDTGRNPIFDVMFNHLEQHQNHDEHGIPKISGTRGTSKFDLCITTINRGNRYVFHLEYSIRLFKKETIRRFSRYYLELITQILRQPLKKICDLELISHHEKRELRQLLTCTDNDIPRNKTVHRLFRQQAAQTPDRIALVGPAADAVPRLNNEPCAVSYREFDLGTDRLAGNLKERGVSVGDIVAVKIRRSLEMVYAIMAVIKTGAAYLPISVETPAARVRYMLEDSGAKVLFMEKGSTINADEIPPGIDVIGTGALKEPGTLQLDPSQEIQESCGKSEDPVYVIYTSGTTGRPRGVVVEHRNAVNVLDWFGRKYELHRRCHVLQMSEITFDPSVNQIFGTFLNGGVLHLIRKDVLLNLEALRRTIQRHQINLLNFIPAPLERLLGDTDAPRLNSVQTVISGGERLDETVKNNITRKGYRLFNQYGPTETTIDALASRCRYRDAAVMLGTPIANTRCLILDNYRRPVPIGVVGELWIAGAGVARGYLNRPELTAETFVHVLPEPLDTPEEQNRHGTHRYYRTGDRVKLNTDGRIEFRGRIDQQVKIRGYRIEPREIERQLLAHHQIKEAVVAVKTGPDGEPVLCAYPVYRKPQSHQSIYRHLARQLPEYMLPASIVPLEQIPRNASGKIDMESLPQPEIKSASDGINRTLPRDDTERIQQELWSAVLGIEKTRIGIDDNFFQLGGHSLKATILLAQMQKRHRVELGLPELFRSPTIRTQAQALKEAKKGDIDDIPAVEEREYYPVSHNQRRLWMMHQADPDSTAYHITRAVTMTAPVSHQLVKRCIAHQMERHESLRTGFKTVDNEPVQFIAKPDPQQVPLTVIHLSEEDEPERQRSLNEEQRTLYRPYDLETPPLFRVHQININHEDVRLVFHFHHIITDGTSMEILEAEFIRLYDALKKGENVNLEPLLIQYKDYAVWQNNRTEQRGKGKAARLHWERQLQDGLPELQLPFKTEEPGDRLTAAVVYNRVPEDICRRLQQYAIENNTTLFMVLYAVYNLLMAYVTGQDTIVTSVIGAGRQQTEMTGVVGYFVNPVITKIRMDLELEFRQLLHRVNENVLEALEYQSYPVDQLCAEKGMRYPKISAAFNMLNIKERPAGTSGESVSPKDNPSENSASNDCVGGGEHRQEVKFPLVLFVTQNREDLELRWQYRKSQIELQLIEKMSTVYLQLLEEVTENEEDKQEGHQDGDQEEKQEEANRIT
jgi:fengycin family lipopeptide synthetase D